MTRNSRRFFRLPRWGRRYITLDRYMSGDFWRLFAWTFGISVAAFLLIWLILHLCGVWFMNDNFAQQWSLGESFVQMSNPSRHIDQGISAWEWIAIVIMNLFGLFVLNGVVLTLLVNWVSNRKDRFTQGDARYDYVFTRNYSVIIGGHKIVSTLAEQLISQDSNDYVVVQTQRDVAEVRKEIFARIKNEQLARNIIIYSGDRTSWHELEELHLGGANEIYIIGESRDIDGTSHDAINLQCWDLITRHISTFGRPAISCHVMFDYQSTFTAFQFTDINKSDKQTFRFMPFSIYENWVQQVLITGSNAGKESVYIPLDGHDGISFDSQQRVHLIIIGMSKMGTALALEAAHIAHYPNFNNPKAGRPRTLITFIDRNARREMLFFMGRSRELFKLARWRFVEAPTNLLPPFAEIYDSSGQINATINSEFPWHDPMNPDRNESSYYGAYLGENLIDIDYEFIQGEVALPSIQKYISDACADNINMREASSKTTIAVCLPVAVEAMSTAIYFDNSVYENVQQIWVQQSDSGALIDAVRHGTTGDGIAKFSSLRPFGMIDECDYLMRCNSPLPKLVAYAYSCMDDLKNKFLNQTDADAVYKLASETWEKISSEGGKSAIAKMWSNVYCANSFTSKARSVGYNEDVKEFPPETVSILAEVEHNRWVVEQLLLGIRPVDRSFADSLPVEDNDMRAQLKRRNIHPDIISNEKLGSTGKYDRGIAQIIPKAFALARMIQSRQNTPNHNYTENEKE